MKISTICFMIQGENIYLANKKQGFGAGYLNGYGGKVRPGETVVAGAVRELKEESRFIIEPSYLQNVAIIDFFEEDTHIFECHVFFITNWDGRLQETKEMGPPELFPRNQLPFGHMWKADEVWLPLVCEGKKIRATARYKKEMKELISFDYTPLTT